MKHLIFLTACIALFSLTGIPVSIAQWMPTNGPICQAVYSFAVSGTNLFAATNQGIFVTANDGANWKEVDAGITDKSITSLAVIGQNLFAGNIENVFLSTNNGESWTSIYQDQNLYVRAFTVSDTILFACSDKGILITSDNGITWKVLNLGENAIAVSGSNIFVGSGVGSDRSTNSGLTWMPMSTGLPQLLGFYKFLIDANDIYAVVENVGVMLSVDNGASWAPANNGVKGDSIQAIIAGNEGIFIGTIGQGVLLSTDKGTNWTSTNTGLTNLNIGALVISNKNIFAGTWYNGDVWRRPLSDFAAVQPAPSLSHEVELFPNPTLGFITIYSAAESVLHVSVANVLGSEVAESGDHASGSGEISLDLLKLPPGTYFVRISTPEGMVMRKVVKV